MSLILEDYFPGAAVVGATVVAAAAAPAAVVAAAGAGVAPAGGGATPIPPAGFIHGMKFSAHPPIFGTKVRFIPFAGAEIENL